MSEIKVSIIIPVYKAEKLLCRCLDSVLAQSFPDWECILVDDGSPDSSGAILDEYAARDTRFKVIHKENGGVSSARNAGLDMAQGEWICFIDADDWVEKHYLSILLHGDADMVCCGFSMTSGKTYVPENRSLSFSDIAKELKWLANREPTLGVPWCKLFKRRIIVENKLRFDVKMRLGEDSLFVATYLRYCNSLDFLAEPLYCYDGVWGGDPKKYVLSEEEMLYMYQATMACKTSLREVFPGTEDVVSCVCPAFMKVEGMLDKHTASWCYQVWKSYLPDNEYHDERYFYTRVFNVGDKFCASLFHDGDIDRALLMQWNRFMDMPYKYVVMPTPLLKLIFLLFRLHAYSLVIWIVRWRKG